MLITLSGIDGAGKSTQMARLQAHFQAHGRVPVCVWTRGGYTSLCSVLKSMARRLAGGKLPAPGPSEQRNQLLRKGWIQFFWLTIAILDLIRLYGIQIRLWRLLGRPVICDRYVWDTLVDFRLNFARNHVENWWLWRLLLKAVPQPDVAIFLEIPVEESIRRSHVKGDPFPEPPEKRTRRFTLYQEMIPQGYWHVIDATRPVESVFGEIVSIVDGTKSVGRSEFPGPRRL